MMHLRVASHALLVLSNEFVMSKLLFHQYLIRNSVSKLFHDYEKHGGKVVRNISCIFMCVYISMLK